MGELVSTERTALRRHPERGTLDRATVNAVLDEALVCTVAFVDNGRRFAIPMLHGRKDDVLYMHGSISSRMLKLLSSGADCCVSATLVDGLVLARSVFRHSVNYRSVVLFGSAVEVTDPDERLAALEVIVEHVVPGRTTDARGPSRSELAATQVIRMQIDEGSAKVRTGAPVDAPEDVDLPIWAGELPLSQVAGEPRPAAGVPASVATPSYVTDYARRR